MVSRKGAKKKRDFSHKGTKAQRKAVPGFTVDVPNKRRFYARPDKVRLKIFGARPALRGRQPQPNIV